MERWQNKVAVVTGASSGIGAAIAKDLVNVGMRVLGLARRTELIEELAKTLPQERQSLLTAIRCDVTQLESVNEAFDEIIARFGGVDILVNNAGIAHLGQLVTMDPQIVQNILNTNVMGIVHCTQRAFQCMQERNVSGHVVLINSIGGHSVFAGVPGEMPIFNIYSPTKFAVTSMAEMFRQEFLRMGAIIKVTSISPGLVDTDMSRIFQEEQDCSLRPEDISSAVLYALSTPPNVQIQELIITPVG